MSGRRIAAAAALLASLLASPCPAVLPEDVPDPRQVRGGWVSDQAGLLSPAGISALDAIADSLSRSHGAQLAIVTVGETGDRDPRSFATALFQRWGIGRAGVDDGILILVVRDARRIEVETGYGIEGVLPDGRVGALLDRAVIPRFREGDWEGGLIAAAEGIASAVRSGASPESPPARTPAASGPGPLPWIAGVLTAIVGGVLLRRRLRICPKCRRPMRRLSEQQDDDYLSLAERLEETLHSMDHRIWRCDRCAILTVEHARRLFSAFEQCPDCHRRTVEVQRVTVRAATTSREGLAEVTKHCRNAPCRFHARLREVLPRVEVSSSSGGSGGGSSRGSSGGSFGGGRSGGGGAGRSW